MRVSFVLRSAEASSLGLCNITSVNYRDMHIALSSVDLQPVNPTIGTSKLALKKAVNSVVFPGGPPAQY